MKQALPHECVITSSVARRTVCCRSSWHFGQREAARSESRTIAQRTKAAALAESLKKLGISMPKQILSIAEPLRQPPRHRHTPGVHLPQGADKSAKIRPSAQPPRTRVRPACTALLRCCVVLWRERAPRNARKPSRIAE
jgi:hypothetical protein